MKKEDLKWWLKTGAEVLGTTAIAFAPELLQLFPENTLLFKLAIPLGAAIKLFKMKSEYKKDTLPSGVASKTLDKLPNEVTVLGKSIEVTGVKGSKKEETL
jgi:hypothetical protein